MTQNEFDSQEAVPAMRLTGQNLADGWRVVERLDRGSDATGGMWSVGYRVTADGSGSLPAGTEGFLKALDYSWATQQPDQARAIQYMVEAFNFERDIVEHCSSRRMSNVVRGFTSGEVTVEGPPLFSRVNYLVFEVAPADVRRHLDSMSAFDAAWALRSLHNVANGLRQLHQATISHQDLKPSNVLVFDSNVSKIGDLGRASMRDVRSPFDGLEIAGDKTYAPPELLYGHLLPDATHRRRAVDMYQMGSMVMYIFTKVGTTASLARAMDSSLWYQQWTGGFEGALPFLRNAFDTTCEQLIEATPSWLRADIVQVFRELCDPDPLLRGDPKKSVGTLTRLDMQRYVSHLDRLARKAEINLKAVVTGR